MGMPHHIDGFKPHKNSFERLRTSEILYCCYCDNVFDLELIIHHWKICPKKDLFKTLSYEQTVNELLLYIFGFVKNLDKRIIFTQDTNNIALNLYDLLYNLKCDINLPEAQELAERYPLYIIRIILHLYYAFVTSKIPMISHLREVVTNIYGDGFLNPYLLTTSDLYPNRIEDGNLISPEF